MKAGRWKLSMLALSSLGLAALPVWGYSYTWVGESSTNWCGQLNDWTRYQCGYPCPECPDDAGDSATISLPVNIASVNKTIGALTVRDANVRLGTVTTGVCFAIYDLSTSSVTVTATVGHTAQLRFATCQSVVTD